MSLTENESASLERTASRIENLRTFLHTQHPPSPSAPPLEWFGHLAKFKQILGNFSNDLSFASCLLAKEYLSARFSLVPFDVAQKPQGASGLDIDERTSCGALVIAEIKTTTPYHKNRFGAAQTTALRKDFAKLISIEAEHKFMFVTDSEAFDALKTGFTAELPGVTIVCLTTGDEYANAL